MARLAVLALALLVLAGCSAAPSDPVATRERPVSVDPLPAPTETASARPAPTDPAADPPGDAGGPVPADGGVTTPPADAAPDTPAPAVDSGNPGSTPDAGEPDAASGPDATPPASDACVPYPFLVACPGTECGPHSNGCGGTVDCGEPCSVSVAPDAAVSRCAAAGAESSYCSSCVDFWRAHPATAGYCAAWAGASAVCCGNRPADRGYATYQSANATVSVPL